VEKVLRPAPSSNKKQAADIGEALREKDQSGEGEGELTGYQDEILFRESKKELTSKSKHRN